MESSISIKAYLTGGHGRNAVEIHRFNLETTNNTVSFNSLKEKLFALFPQLNSASGKLQISYKDEEGDMICISSDDELSLALSIPSNDNLFRIYIGRQANSGCRRRLDDQGSSDVHPGVTCDGCDNSVRGFRYKCVICPDYDLCGCCEGKKLHSEHVMLRMPLPNQVPNWEGMGRGAGRCPFSRRRFQNCYEKFKTASQNFSQGATGGTETKTELPFQKLIETAASQFGAFVNQMNADGGNNSADNNVPTFPQPQEILKNVGDVVASVLGQMGMNVDVQTEDPNGRRDKCGEMPGETSKSDEGKIPNDVEMTSENEPLLTSRKSSDGETADGWTCIGDKDKQANQTSTGAIPNEHSRIQSALDQMLAMGFSNEGGWLSQLLMIKNGNIDGVLEVLTPAKK